jgi:hypothetical protein
MEFLSCQSVSHQATHNHVFKKTRHTHIICEISIISGKKKKKKNYEKERKQFYVVVGIMCHFKYVGMTWHLPFFLFCFFPTFF